MDSTSEADSNSERGGRGSEEIVKSKRNASYPSTNRDRRSAFRLVSVQVLEFHRLAGLNCDGIIGEWNSLNILS